jgi:hypothetical protein
MGPVRLNHHIDPGSGDIDTRKFLDDLVHLHDNDSIMEGSRLNNHRRIFCIRPGVKVALCIRLFGANKNDIGNQIDQQSRIEFDVGMDRTDGRACGLLEVATRAGSAHRQRRNPPSLQSRAQTA